jgi:hypothetical protein
MEHQRQRRRRLRQHFRPQPTISGHRVPLRLSVAYGVASTNGWARRSSTMDTFSVSSLSLEPTWRVEPRCRLEEKTPISTGTTLPINQGGSRARSRLQVPSWPGQEDCMGMSVLSSPSIASDIPLPLRKQTDRHLCRRCPCEQMGQSTRTTATGISSPCKAISALFTVPTGSIQRRSTGGRCDPSSEPTAVYALQQ